MLKKKKLLSLAEVAEIYSFSLLTLRRWSAERRFPLYKVSNRIRVSPTEFEAWLSKSKVEPKDRRKI